MLNAMKRRSSAFDDVPIICLDDDENNNEERKIEDANPTKGKSKVLTLGDIQRDNRAAERRKRRILGFEAKRTERIVPLHKGKTEQDNRAVKYVEFKTKTLSEAAPLVRIQQDNIDSSRKKPRIAESEIKRTSRYVLLPETQRKDNRAGIDTLSTAIPLVRVQEDVNRDNIDSKRRKRRLVEFEARKTSKYVLLPKPQRQSNRTGNDTLSRAIPLVRVQEDVQRSSNTDSGRTKTKSNKQMTEALSRDIPLVRTENDIQRYNRCAERSKRITVEFEARRSSRYVLLPKTQQQNKRARNDTLSRDVPSVSVVQDVQRNNKDSKRRKPKADKLQTEILSKDISLVRTESVIERDNRAIEWRRRRVVDFEAIRTTRVVPLLRTQQRQNKTENLMAVPLVRTLDDIQQENKNSGRSKTKAAEACRLARQVNRAEATNLRDAVKVKVENDLQSGFDDSNSDIIAISESPFPDGDGTTPFVVSKSVIDLDEGCKEIERGSSWFKNELMNILREPYDEEELKQLHNEASIHRMITRSREIRNGRETDYKTDKLGQSYLERFTDFENEYKAVDSVDKVKALALLRGFFFYLKNVCHDGAFKPWMKNQ